MIGPLFYREQVNLGLAVTIFTMWSETNCRIQSSRNGKIKVPAMVSPHPVWYIVPAGFPLIL